MALLIEGGRIPPRWAEHLGQREGATTDEHVVPSDALRIAFINNMPDAALEDTEVQFFELLNSASGATPVCVKLCAIEEVPRGEPGQRHLTAFYAGADVLFKGRFDAVIMTGTEPRSANLRDEPYWQTLANVIDWAENNTTSTVFSCLAAHAAVLHRDGIPRRPLSDKQFGVFESMNTGDHELTRSAPAQVRFPHSRWNEVREDDLLASGYRILTKSADAGADLFVKKTKRSLFVNFQGHPEYGSLTLLKEFRRDIRRFLKRERETFPTMPKGYFDAEAEHLLSEFREQALSDPREERITAFPEAAVASTLQHSWKPSSICIYSNWLRYVTSRKVRVSAFAVATSSHIGSPTL